MKLPLFKHMWHGQNCLDIYEFPLYTCKSHVESLMAIIRTISEFGSYMYEYSRISIIQTAIIQVYNVS